MLFFRLLQSGFSVLRIGYLGLLVTLASLVGATPGIAQNQGIDIRQPDHSVFAPAPREVVRPLIRAAKAIKKGETDRAVTWLGQILTDPNREDYLVPLGEVKGSEGVNTSLRLRAEEMLGRMSIEDRAPYRLRYGTLARKRLESAIDAGDYDAISLVMRRFFYTEAGYTATMLMGHHFLSQGRPIAAAKCFQRVVATEEARRKRDPEVSILLAICWMMGDAPDRAVDVLKRLKRHFPQGSIRFQEKEIPLFQQDGDAIEWLHRLVGNSTLRKIRNVNQWLMFGGNPARNASTQTGFPLMLPIWSVPTAQNPVERNIIDRIQEERVLNDQTPLPTVQPLCIGDIVIMRTLDRMEGIDFETGKRLWVFPPRRRKEEKSDADWLLSEEEGTESHELTSVEERLLHDALYGHASSDGESVFFIPQPGIASFKNYRATLHLFARSWIKREFNELKAVDLKRQGALRWEVGGATGLDEPKLAKAFFLGPPLPLEGTLYAICQREDEIHLVALAPNSGKLLWSQQLVTVEGGVDVAEDTYRRLAGLTPSFSEGTLVCPTGACALVAVDLSTRSLLWGYQYQTPGSREVAPIAPHQTSAASIRSGLWHESTVTIANGTIVHTPVDSQDLICVDLQTGMPRWKEDRSGTSHPASRPEILSRDDSLFVGCVENQKIILVGRTSVRAVGLTDNVPIWELDTRSFGCPSGRGYSGNGFYYLPMTGRQVLKIDLVHGKIVARSKTEGVLGNLVCYRNRVISHGADRLACFPLDVPTRKMLEEAEATGKRSPQQWALKAELEYQRGELEQAVRSIEMAYRLSKNARFEPFFTKLLVELMGVDGNTAIAIAQPYKDSLFSDDNLVWFRASIHGMLLRGELNEAFDRLLIPLTTLDPSDPRLQSYLEVDLATHDGEVRKPASDSTNGSEELPSLRGSIRIRFDRWIRSELEAIVDRADADQVQHWSEQLERAFANRAPLSPVAWFELFQNVPVALTRPDRRFEIADQLLEQGEFLRARQLLKPLVDSSQASVRRQALAMLAPHGIVPHLGETNKEGEPDALPSRSSPGGSFDVSFEIHNVDSEDDDVWSPIPVLISDPPALSDMRFYFCNKKGELELRDANGVPQRRMVCRPEADPENPKEDRDASVVGNIKMVDDLLLLTVSTELFGIDWLKFQRGEEALLWSKPMIRGRPDPNVSIAPDMWKEMTIDSSTGSRSLRRVIAAPPSVDGVCFLEGNTLFCVDPITGKTVWQRSRVPSYSKLLGDNTQVAVWNPVTRKVDLIEIATGRKVKTVVIKDEWGTLWTHRGLKLLFSGYEKIADAPEPPSDTESDSEEPNYFEMTNKTHEKKVGLFDLSSGRFIWERHFSFDTLGCRIRNEKLAFFFSTGELEILQMETGKTETRLVVPMSKRDREAVDEIGILQTEQATLVHLHLATSNGRRIQDIFFDQRYYGPPFWGQVLVLALDPKRNTPLWRRPVFIQNFQPMPEQPGHLPFYVLVRKIRGKDRVQCVLLDIASGEKVGSILVPYKYHPGQQIRWNPKNDTMLLRLEYSEITIRRHPASDAPPRPMARLTNDSSLPLQYQIRQTERPAVPPHVVAQELEQLRQAAEQAEARLLKARQEEADKIQQEERGRSNK